MFSTIKSDPLQSGNGQINTHIFYLQSSDVRSLLGRSLARAKSTHYTGALADAAQAAGMTLHINYVQY